jgi:hypothetical protein
MASSSSSPTASEAELQARKDGPEGSDKALKDAAKSEKQQQTAALAGGKAKGAARKAATADKKAAREGNVALLRDGEPGPSRGRVDNMTRRDDTDVDEGHFCLIDYGNSPEAAKAVKDTLAPKGSALADQGFEPGVGTADYGVYLQPGSLDENNYPVTAVVMLRDEYAAQVVVPYDSLKPAAAGRR